MKLTPIVVTLGEPAGIGPEITIKTKQKLKDKIPFFVIGDYNFITSIASKYSLETKCLQHPSETFSNMDKLCVLQNKSPFPISPGEINLKNSPSVISNIDKAVKLIKNGLASALVTNPINKWALKKGAAFQFEGHTDYLSNLDNPKNPSVMMLTNKNGFRVVPITVHIPLKEVCKKLTAKLIEDTILTVEESLRTDFQIDYPKILVTGLNPHSGESSTIGTEEETLIRPVILKLLNQGVNVIGPVSADTAFVEKNRSQFDAFVCMYHDQALIPIKTLSFSNESTNITLGLSFVRTSPDHGTAINIAGKDLANPNSLTLAIEQAHKIKSVRKINDKR